MTKRDLQVTTHPIAKNPKFANTRTFKKRKKKTCDIYIFTDTNRDGNPSPIREYSARLDPNGSDFTRYD